MADKRCNLDNIVSKYIHRPTIKSKSIGELPPLYARTGNENESNYDSDGIKNPIWQREAAITYNSPTNARRLFIGDKKAAVQYFQPIHRETGSGNYWSHTAYSTEDEIGKLANEVFNYNQLVMEAAMNGGDKPSRTVLSKTGLGAISKNWTMSNLEEVYITPSILASEEIRSRFPDAEKVYLAFKNNPTGKMFKGTLPLEIFEAANGGNIKDIRNRFPRLRTVAFVTNVEQLLEVRNATNLREGLPATLSEAGLRWYLHVSKLGAGSVSSFMVADVPFVDKGKMYSEFSIRPGIYLFDSVVLQSFVGKYNEKILEIARQNRDKKLGKEETESAVASKKSQYEEYLDAIFEAKGQAVTTAAIQLALARTQAKELDEIFNAMTTEGKAKYRGLLGR